MSIANKDWITWSRLASIGLVVGLTAVGCSRSEEQTDTESEDDVVVAEAPAPAVECDNPIVQDRLKSTLKTDLNQQAQTLAANYADDSQIALSNSTISSKVNGILMDIQNTAVVQETNDRGMTTCQASVSMTLPSEDLYLASELHAANNQPSLQTRLAQNNIRINNNMLVDDAFSYVVGTQSGQIQTRIVGQPAMVSLVADVIGGATFASALNEREAQRAAQAAERRRREEARAAERREAEQARAAERRAEQRRQEAEAAARATTQQPRVVTPAAPREPAAPTPAVTPASPPSVGSTPQAPVDGASAASVVDTASVPKAVPKDESIDMVIVEDKSATY